MPYAGLAVMSLAPDWWLHSLGLTAPAETPKEIVDKLHAAAVKALADPAIKEQLLAQVFVPGGMGPADMQTFVGDEIEKWTKVVQDAGAKVD